MSVYNIVEPGGLITSAKMNDLISKLQFLENRSLELQLLETRIQALEASGKGRVLVIEPVDGEKLGREIHIIGKEFAFPPSENTVRVLAPSLGVEEDPVDVLATVISEKGSLESLFVFLPKNIERKLTRPMPVLIEVSSEDRLDAFPFIVEPFGDTIPDPKVTSFGRKNGTPNSDLHFGVDAIAIGSDFAEDPLSTEVSLVVKVTSEGVLLPGVKVTHADDDNSKLTLTIPERPQGHPWDSSDVGFVYTLKLSVSGASRSVYRSGKIRKA